MKLILPVLPLSLALCFGAPSGAWAIPQIGRTLPAFAVEDLSGTLRTQRDVVGRWTVILAMTDKDAGPSVAAWYHRIATVAPPGSRLLTFAALDLFPLILTLTIVSEARGSTPRNAWPDVWLSRNGSLAASLGLPESEVPWIIVVDPLGRVIDTVHAQVDDAGVARVAAALDRARPTSAQPGASASVRNARP